MEKNNKILTAMLVISIIWIASFGISKMIETNISLKDKIAILPIKGIIMSEGQSFGILSEEYASSVDIVKKLEDLNSDKSIKAIVLDINSPGGGAVASKEIAEKISSMDKPVVSVIKEYGASGAYWIASSSDYIIADELSITGSIGVISSYLEFSELFSKYGINYEQLTAGEYKDAGSPYRKLTSAEKELFQKKLDIIHQKFKDQVAINRNMSQEKINKVATGLFYLGSEAYSIGLIDSFGNKDTAIEKAKELAQIKEAKIIEITEKKSMLDLLSNVMSSAFYSMGKGIGSVLLRPNQGISL